MKNSYYTAFVTLSLMALAVEVFALSPATMLPFLFCAFLSLTLVLGFGAEPYFKKQYNKVRRYARRNLKLLGAEQMARRYIMQ
jgi:membrane protein implicated in regulation of membrane protease activity